jgi:predicted nucleotidyltransferase
MLKKLRSITPKTLEVLYLFASNPLDQFHGREVVRQTGVSLGAVHQALAKLYGLGLLDREKRGRMYFYSFNMKSAISKQFKVLFNVSALDDLVDRIKQFSERVILFGSCAEGTDIKDSDIDLFVLTSDTKTVQHEVAVYEQKIDRKLSPIIINSNELAKMKKRDKPLYERVLRGITLWERE